MFERKVIIWKRDTSPSFPGGSDPLNRIASGAAPPRGSRTSVTKSTVRRVYVYIIRFRVRVRVRVRVMVMTPQAQSEGLELRPVSIIPLIGSYPLQ